MHRILRSAGVAALVAFVGAACGSSSPGVGGSSNGEAGSWGAGADASLTGDAASVGRVSTVTVFDKALFAFPGAPGGGRRRTATGMFPAGGTYERIVLHLQLDCPPGGCDHWDRIGSLGVVTQPPVNGGSRGTVVEIARYVTPFGVGAPAWDYDVTDLAPLLTGGLTLQGFIDTSATNTDGIAAPTSIRLRYLSAMSARSASSRCDSPCDVRAART
jgi:hypothetical protein